MEAEERQQHPGTFNSVSSFNDYLLFSCSVSSFPGQCNQSCAQLAMCFLNKALRQAEEANNEMMGKMAGGLGGLGGGFPF